MRSIFKITHLTLTLQLDDSALFTAQAESAGKVASVPTKFQQECAASHVAYWPGLLPAASWQRLAWDLSRHYGLDAPLDATSQREIGDWLKSHAGTDKRASKEPPHDRITNSVWFLRKHNKNEVAPAGWTRTAVGSPANCVARHGNAAQGNFSERDIRVPK